MIMSIFGLENKITFEEGKINVLEIYNKKFFRRMIEILNGEEEAESNEIVLLDNEKRVELKKNVLVFTDLFNIDFNSKKIITKIYNELIESIKKRQDDELENLTIKLRNYLIEEINELPFEFNINSELEINDLLKAFNLKIDTTCYTTIVEKIEFIINIIANLKMATILVIPNLKVYLEKEEIIEIYKYSLYNNIKLLILENSSNEKIENYEIKNIIDKEFDEF